MPPVQQPAGNANESNFRSQLAGFRWAQGSTNDSLPTASVPPAGGQRSYFSFGNYLPLSSSDPAATGQPPQPTSTGTESFLGLSRWERFVAFLVCIAGSAVCFMFSILFLLSPIPRLRKFALAFSVGSGLFMFGFSILWGPVEHFKHMISAPRLPFTVSYLLTLSLTLYFALGPRSTLPTLLAAIAQIASLLIYLAAYFPGGVGMLRYGGGMMARGMGGLLPI